MFVNLFIFLYFQTISQATTFSNSSCASFNNIFDSVTASGSSSTTAASPNEVSCLTGNILELVRNNFEPLKIFSSNINLSSKFFLL